MIRHVVMFRWNDSVDEAHVAATSAAFSRLPALIPEIIAYHYGPDLGVGEGNFDYAVAALFDSVDDFLAYRAHPDHVALLNTYLAPHWVERRAVQFEED
jgi:hypothetical protein